MHRGQVIPGLLAALIASALSAGVMSVYAARLACHIGNTEHRRRRSPLSVTDAVAVLADV
jgi:hydroxymethylglutaryl-CoA reductase